MHRTCPCCRMDVCAATAADRASAEPSARSTAGPAARSPALDATVLASSSGFRVGPAPSVGAGATVVRRVGGLGAAAAPVDDGAAAGRRARLASERAGVLQPARLTTPVEEFVSAQRDTSQHRRDADRMPGTAGAARPQEPRPHARDAAATGGRHLSNGAASAQRSGTRVVAWAEGGEEATGAVQAGRGQRLRQGASKACCVQ